MCKSLTFALNNPMQIIHNQFFRFGNTSELQHCFHEKSIGIPLNSKTFNGNALIFGMAKNDIGWHMCERYARLGGKHGKSRGTILSFIGFISWLEYTSTSLLMNCAATLHTSLVINSIYFTFGNVQLKFSIITSISLLISLSNFCGL